MHFFTKILRLKSNERKDAHNKIYTERSLNQFIEKVAMDNGISFSAMGRIFLLEGITASGIEISKDGAIITKEEAIRL